MIVLQKKTGANTGARRGSAPEALRVQVHDAGLDEVGSALVWTVLAEDGACETAGWLWILGMWPAQTVPAPTHEDQMSLVGGGRRKQSCGWVDGVGTTRQSRSGHWDRFWPCSWAGCHRRNRCC
eukprot:COSAG06_NODE_3773_length_4920_cov_2.695499_4_plen_124_part_00